MTEMESKSEKYEKFPGNTSDSSERLRAVASSPSTGRARAKHSERTKKNDELSINSTDQKGTARSLHLGKLQYFSLS